MAQQWNNQDQDKKTTGKNIPDVQSDRNLAGKQADQDKNQFGTKQDPMIQKKDTETPAKTSPSRDFDSGR